MIIFVDGYNILRAIIHKPFIEDADRLWFLKLLNVYAKKKKHQINVVFDSNAPWSRTERYSDLVSVTYTRTGETADNFIIQKCKEYKNKELMVITSDRVLHDQVIYYGHLCIGSMHFYNLIKESIGRKAEVIYSDATMKKYVDDPNLDILMKEGTQHIPVKDEEFSESRKPKGKVLKKTKRTLLKKIKKL